MNKNIKLFRVRIEYDTVVAADCDQNARFWVFQNGNEIDDEPTLVDAVEITSASELPPKWDKRCIPWGEPCPMERTIKNYLDGTEPKTTSIAQMIKKIENA